MAQTGILQRRGLKENLLPPIDGEIIVATDTGEYGWSDGAGGTTWKKLEDFQPIKTVTSPPTGAESDVVGTVYLVVTAVLSITITPTNGVIDTSLGTPNTVQYTATATYGDGTNSDVTGQVAWTSNDALISIDGNGVASYVGAGGYVNTVGITALLDGITDSVSLSVTNPIDT